MQYTTSDVSQLLGLSPQQIRRLVHTGFIHPAHGARGAFLFSFQDLILLRAAAALRKANISPARTLRALRSLRRQLPFGRSLTEVRITTDGTRVVVHDGSMAWQPDSGQTIIDFDVADIAAKAEPIAKKRFRLDHDFGANEWFDTAVELEAVAPLEARQAYMRTLALNPKHADAHVNLGRLLHEEGRTVEAATHYLQALRYDTGHTIAAFNLGVAMEDLGRVSEAMKAYQQCVTADPAFADAHYNLAALLEKIGDQRGAIRHLTKYRRLGGTSSS
jgi:tetratricopeptide (TPR) repeat protein